MIKIQKHWVVHLIGVLTLLCFTSGCNRELIRVNSDPIGATVLLDGRNTGKTTPADLLIRDIPLGMHTITIAKEGYLPTTPPSDIKVRVNPGQILCSILLTPICVPKNLIDNLWKEAE